MHQLAVPMQVVTSSGIAQTALHSGGRFLLTLAMALFLSYLLFVLGVVAFATFVRLVKFLRQRAHHRRSIAWPASPQPRQAGNVSPVSTPRAVGKVQPR